METTSSPQTMETTRGGGGNVYFQTSTMTVDIINEYNPYYCYIMCGFGSLPAPLNVTAQVTIDWIDYGVLYTLYVFNPESITCTATAVANSVFNSDSDDDTIIITDTIIAWYNKTKEAYFTLATDVKNTLSSSECNKYYSFSF